MSALTEINQAQQAWMDGVLTQVEQALSDWVAPTAPERLGEAMRYAVLDGGKRLRPLLVLLAARSLGYNGKQHVDMAAVIEFIHTATLLHDDVVDVSALRRGRATANAEWGNAPSVLVGDFLYSRAFQMLVALGDMQIMQIMADTTNTIAEGEVLQLVNAGDITTNEERYRRVIACKTAQLFEAAAHCGAIIAGADTETQKELAQ